MRWHERRKEDFPGDDLTNDDYSNIEEHEIYQEQTIRNNSLYTIVDNKLPSSLEDLNDGNDWKTTNSHEGKLVMVYNYYNGNKTLHPRTFYALYIDSNDKGDGHLIVKLSTKQRLATMKY